MSATLDVIARQGVSGVSFRNVARVSDIKLGSITYYFDSMEQLLIESFLFFAQSNPPLVSNVIDGGLTTDEVLERIVGLAYGEFDSEGVDRAVSIAHELYAYAGKNSAVEPAVQIWRERGVGSLLGSFDLIAATFVHTFIEGFSTCHFRRPLSWSRSEVERVIRLMVRVRADKRAR
jgi:DNA-binding transcriptional regulator YbjK